MLTFGQNKTQIVAAVKAEVGTPLKSTPDKGIVNFLLESAYSGSSTMRS